MHKHPLLYATRKKLKNRMLATLRSPSQIIYILLMLALLIFSSLSGSSSDSGAEYTGDYREMNELNAIIFVFFTVMFLVTFYISYTNGTTVFTLSDVNLLFPSPLNPRRILFHSLMRQLTTSILLGVFLLFQYSWLHSLYGIKYDKLIVIVLGYGLTLFFSQFVAIVLFCLTNGHSKAGRMIKLMFAAVIAALIIPLLVKLTPVMQSLDYRAAIPIAVEYFSSFWTHIFPFSGWTASMAIYMIEGRYLLAAVFLGIQLLAAAILMFIIYKTDVDYYEDAIESAEKSQSAITAQKEGTVNEVVGKNIRVGKIGIQKGWGANVIYQKHLIENRRSSILRVSNMSLIFIACVIIISVFLREEGILPSFVMSSYMLMFSVTLGRFPRELIKPFIYLMPEPPVKKLFYSLKENLISSVYESILLFIPVGLIVSAAPIEIAVCIIGRISFSLLFLCANIAIERIFGSNLAKGLTMFLYIVISMLMTAPGIVIAMVLSFVNFFVSIPVLILALLCISVINVLVSFLVLFFCRNLLQYADTNTR